MGKPLDVMDFVKGFILHAYVHHVIENFPGPGDWRWHVLAYRAKRELGPTFPEFNFSVRFDWDASHPRCNELQTALIAMGLYFDLDKEGRYRIEFFDIEHHAHAWDFFSDKECAEKCHEVACSIEGFFKE